MTSADFFVCACGGTFRDEATFVGHAVNCVEYERVSMHDLAGLERASRSAAVDDVLDGN